MRTFITLRRINRRELPAEFRSDDNRYADALVEYFLEKYTEPGEKVLDMFAGFGTTLLVAEDMGRVPFGIEYDQRRFDYIVSQVHHKANIIHGDSSRLSSYKLPVFDFVMTSPYYMAEDDELNPLTCCRTAGEYKIYLKDLRGIFAQLKHVLKLDGHLVIEASNLKTSGVTTFAWDLAKEISSIFYFEGEVVVGWEAEDTGCGTYGYGYDHSYCLIFRNVAE
jgi:DNA modification methylase